MTTLEHARADTVPDGWEPIWHLAGELEVSHNRIKNLIDSGQVEGGTLYVECTVRSRAGNPYTTHRKKTYADADAVRRLINGTPMESESLWPITKMAALLKIDRGTLSQRAKAGRLDGAVKGMTLEGKKSWLVPASMLPELQARYRDPRLRRRKVLRRRVDGVWHQRCTECMTWRVETDFHRDTDTTTGRTSKCKHCAQERCRVYRLDTVEQRAEADKKRWRRYRDWVRKEGGEQHRRYKHDSIVSFRELWAIIRDHAGEPTNREIAAVGDVHEDLVRRSRTRNVTVGTADKILSALNLGHYLDDLVDPPGLDGWCSISRACLGCGRCNVAHHSRGYCSRCILYLRRGMDPAFVSDWCKHPEVNACRSCDTTDREHFSRGLCSPCHYRAKRDGLLDQYPPLYNLRSDDDGGSDGEDRDAAAE